MLHIYKVATDHAKIKIVFNWKANEFSQHIKINAREKKFKFESGFSLLVTQKKIIMKRLSWAD